MKLLHIVGTRPNFMKAGPVLRALSGKSEVCQILVHSGQHYDARMSKVFFEDLNLPRPDHFLGASGSTHTQMTAEIMTRFEEVLITENPQGVILYGDVNTTLAAALVCAKSGVPLAHVEAGLRSFDRSMPEELNRIVIDHLSDLFFTPSADGNQNLLSEGIPEQRIHFVGNVMIDSLRHCLNRIRRPLGIPLPEVYCLATLHRPSNVDEPQQLSNLMGALLEIGERIPVVFPVHPRTRKSLQELELPTIDSEHLLLIEPLGYLEFLWLQRHARLIITDSGGVQEESTFFGVPCLTFRKNTERPVTVESGTNRIVGNNPEVLVNQVLEELTRSKQDRAANLPNRWDGRAGERIARVLLEQWR